MSRRSKGFNVRCSRETCKARDHFAKHPDEYLRPRKCRCCGGTKFRVDLTHMKRNKALQGEGCKCAGYLWDCPHTIGSPYCWYRKDGTQRMPGDPDFQDRDYDPEREGITGCAEECV